MSGYLELQRQIVDNSNANNWLEAKLEWSYENSYDEHNSHCLCGKSITEVCVIKNTLNSNRLEVGNVCVDKIGHKNVSADHAWLRGDRVRLHKDTLVRMRDLDIITVSDYMFYYDIRTKRKLSSKQEGWIIRIESKVRNYMKKRDRSKTRLDEHVFKNLKTDSMNIKKEHQEMVGQFIIEQGYKIKEGKGTKSFTEIGDILKEIARNIKRLKESYEDSKN